VLTHLSTLRKVVARVEWRREDGQGLVEFALILMPLLLIVVGTVQLGVAISFWHDQQRLAQQGARVAVVDCAAASWCTPSLESHLETETLSNGNRPEADVCFVAPLTGPGGTTPFVGDTVRVSLSAPFDLVPLLGIAEIQIGAQSEMRLERPATHAGIASEGTCLP
jgi:hypothetical protein